MEWSPATIGPAWRRTIAEAVYSQLSRNWPEGQEADARQAVNDALSRVIDAMTGSGQYGISECGRDGIIAHRRLPTGRLVGRGDYRYGTSEMVRFLRESPDRDLVPIVCTPKGGGFLVLDGHHRMRAYDEVARSIPALVFFTESGSGLIRIV